MARRRCEGCGGWLSAWKRSDARWCSRNCYDYYRYPKPFLDADRKFLMGRIPCRSCGLPLKNARRFDAQFCSQKCRQREYRLRVSSVFGTDPRRPAMVPPGRINLEAGRALLRKHLWTDALTCFEQALKVDEQGLGSDHVAVAYDRYEMGNALRALGRVSEARQQYLLAQAIAEYAGSVSVLKRVTPALVALNKTYNDAEFNARWQVQQDSILLKREPPKK